MKASDLQELHRWASKASEVAQEYGLDCFPQEFEICDHEQMLGYMAYSGMPSHYPHWSYGKQFEKQKTMYEYGVSGLPYEMVINSNPCLAYLMRDNSMLLQVLTVAHVYGHNDFFKNNFTFRHTSPNYTLQNFKLHADRIREYIEDPSIGIERVEALLDAAHALSLQCRRNLSIAKPSEEKQRERFVQQFIQNSQDEFDEADLERALRKVPLEPEEDILLFIRDHNHNLESWEKDVLTIVHEQTQYFIPQMETKIMNEGWASYWHHTIMNKMNLPQDMHMEFLVRHSQVLRPHPGGLNPYHLGYQVWNALRIWYDGSLDAGDLRKDELQLYKAMKEDFEIRDAVPPGTGSKTGHEMMFQIRETDRDVSFLRQYLTPVMMRELHLFEFENKKSHRGESVTVVTSISEGDEWRKVKKSLLANIGTASLPVIKVEDANFNNKGTLLLRHYGDGRELEAEYARRTMEYVQRLWENPVVLSATIQKKKSLITIDEDGKAKVTIDE